MDESTAGKKRRSKNGSLVVTRGFNDTLIMRLGQGVDGMVFARELFEEPIRITIMKGKTSRQVRVGIFADRRINIAREEIANPSTVADNFDSVLPLHRKVSLALAFMQAAEDELDKASFRGLLCAAQITVNGSQAEVPET